MNETKDVRFYSVNYGPMLLHQWNDGLWLFTEGPDGHRWVSLRKATEADLAELVPMKGLIRGTTPCSNDGCTESGFPCYDKRNETLNVPDDWLCKSHQIDEGYCAVCGDYWCMASYHKKESE